MRHKKKWIWPLLAWVFASAVMCGYMGMSAYHAEDKRIMSEYRHAVSSFNWSETPSKERAGELASFSLQYSANLEVQTSHYFTYWFYCLGAAFILWATIHLFRHRHDKQASRGLQA